MVDGPSSVVSADERLAAVRREAFIELAGDTAVGQVPSSPSAWPYDMPCDIRS
jgi:hypothetical protein